MQENKSRSELVKTKLENKRLEFVKSIQRFDRKWTIIWLLNIFTYTILGTIFAFTQLNSASFGMIVGIFVSALFLCNHKLDIKIQMDKVEELRELDDQIVEEIKKQEILEKEIEFGKSC